MVEREGNTEVHGLMSSIQTEEKVQSADRKSNLWIGHVKLISAKGRDVGLDASSPQGYNVQ